MTTPPNDGKLPAGKDFVCAAFTLPLNTAPFTLAFDEGGARAKFLPAGWQFIMIEVSDDCAHALFRVDVARLKDMSAKFQIVSNLIKRAYQ